MKAAIHPTYYADAKIKCSCGAVYVVGSTAKELKTELCAACHPFYTGQQKLVDTAGRVDKFQAKRKLSEEIKTASKERAEKKKKKEVYIEKEVPKEVIERVVAKTIEKAAKEKAVAAPKRKKKKEASNG